MPRNKKEGMIFTVLMCGLMVLGMSLYNLAIHGALTASALFGGFPLGFIVAFILDVFVVGVVAKKIAVRLRLSRRRSSRHLVQQCLFQSLVNQLCRGLALSITHRGTIFPKHFEKSSKRSIGSINNSKTPSRTNS